MNNFLLHSLKYITSLRHLLYFKDLTQLNRATEIYFLMSSPLENLAWVKFSLKVNDDILKQLITKTAIVSSLLELSGTMYKTMISPCGSLKLREGTKVIRVGYTKGTRLYFVKKWEADLPPKELIEKLTDTTFTIRIDYLIKGKKRLRSDVYKVRIKIYKNYIDFYIRHISGLLRTSFEEIFSIFKTNFIRNLKDLMRRRLKEI